MGDPINEKLIELIRDRPCLYDTNHSESNLQKVKEKHWSEISKKLLIDATFLKKRWKVIRDRYRKELNTINNGSHSTGKSSWHHFKQISFLEPHMQPRPCLLQLEQVQLLSQPKIEHNDYDDFSEYMEVLETEEGTPNEVPQPQTILDHSRLIAAVKTMPNLYDPHNYNYNSLHLKEVAWQQIAKMMDSTVDSVKLTWQELRDQFRYEYSKPKNNGEVSSFEYCDQLSFLNDNSNHNPSPRCDFESEIVHSSVLSDYNEVGEDDGGSFKHLKEEVDELSSQDYIWFKLDDQDYKMAQFIRKNPILYDKHHPNYKDISMRNRKWTQLSIELGQDSKSLKDRWQTIKQRYKLYNPADQNDANSRKFIDMLAFVDDQNSRADDSDSASNIKYEVESDDCSNPRISFPNSHSPTTTNQASQDSTSHSHVKMFFDSIAAQIEAENLPFRHFSIIQQEVLKVVHQQISSYLENQQ